MNTQIALINEEKLEYMAPLAEIRDIYLEQNYLQATGSAAVDPGYGDGGSDGGWG